MPLALVTGASRASGHALALGLAPTHHVVAVARTQGGLEELDDKVRSLGGEATLAPMDVTVPEAMRQLARALFDRWGRLDLWVHTPSMRGPSPRRPPRPEGPRQVHRHQPARHRRPDRVFGPLLGETGPRRLLRRPPRGEKFFGHYGATKAAQIALARSWAAEGERIGPRVLILQPTHGPPPPAPASSPARTAPPRPPAAEAQRLLPQILG
jgi:NAD(P)-dependent dehydrogenase (short-subunit alcohol dehydrogenase family)